MSIAVQIKIKSYAHSSCWQPEPVVNYLQMCMDTVYLPLICYTVHAMLRLNIQTVICDIMGLVSGHQWYLRGNLVVLKLETFNMREDNGYPNASIVLVSVGHDHAGLAKCSEPRNGLC